MGLETGNTIADLNDQWPLGTDPKSQGDDHIRLIKSVLKNDVYSKALGEVVETAGDTMTGDLNAPNINLTGNLTADGELVGSRLGVNPSEPSYAFDVNTPSTQTTGYLNAMFRNRVTEDDLQNGVILRLLNDNSTGSQYIYFGDADSASTGYIGYRHDNDSMILKNASGIFLTADANGVSIPDLKIPLSRSSRNTGQDYTASKNGTVTGAIKCGTTSVIGVYIIEVLVGGTVRGGCHISSHSNANSGTDMVASFSVPVIAGETYRINVVTKGTTLPITGIYNWIQ